MTKQEADGSTPSLATTEIDTDLNDALAMLEGSDTPDDAEAGPEQPSIDRRDSEGNPAKLVILTKDEFRTMFETAFGLPAQIHPAGRHIALDNGTPMRREAGLMTADSLYDFCRSSGIRWLENILAVDKSGFDKLIQIAAVGWFVVGTASGAMRSAAEIAGEAENRPTDSRYGSETGQGLSESAALGQEAAQ